MGVRVDGAVNSETTHGAPPDMPAGEQLSESARSLVRPTSASCWGVIDFLL
jgi:hypothetical protein